MFVRGHLLFIEAKCNIISDRLEVIGLYYTTLYCTVLYYTVLYYSMLCYAMLCHAMPCLRLGLPTNNLYAFFFSPIRATVLYCTILVLYATTNFHVTSYSPIAVAERSKARNVFAPSNTAIVGSNLT
jgi:hypothetical protein